MGEMRPAAALNPYLIPYGRAPRVRGDHDQALSARETAGRPSLRAPVLTFAKRACGTCKADRLADPRRRAGTQAANVVGHIDQTDLFGIMARALGLQE